MRTNKLLLLLSANLLAVSMTTCASSQKPFDQMTAEEHRVAAAQEHQLAEENLESVTGEGIGPPETVPYDDVYGWFSAEVGGVYSPYGYEIGAPDAYTAWPRVSDPSEKYEDAASRHRENAMRHERAAAALEGRPSPQPLPPERPHDQLLDFGDRDRG
jgi:hypothetical protein